MIRTVHRVLLLLVVAAAAASVIAVFKPTVGGHIGWTW